MSEIKLEKLEKKKKAGYGGKRANSGRKPATGKKELADLKQQVESHAAELVDIQMGEKVIKMSRVLALLSILFTEAFKNKNIMAIKEYFDRTMGKARQPIEGTGENGEFIAKVIILPTRNETTNPLESESRASNDSTSSITKRIL